MSINQQSKVWINKPPWPTPSPIWISMFMSMLMSIFIYRRPPCLMYMFFMYKLTEKAHERIKEKVYVNSKQKSRSYTNRWAQVTCCATSLWPRWRYSKHVFCVFFCILTPVLILPVHLLWVGDARLWCSSGHDRPLPLPQEGLHLIIILRSERTPCIKPKMKKRS